jgi:high-affinity Fe2+/Pb2+ permease
MHDLVSILVPLGCGCVLPIMIVWFSIRESMNKTNQRTQIVLAAIEKNPDMDIEELMEKISPKKKLLKEKLLTKLLCGGITAFLGIALLGYCFVQGNVGGMATATLQQFSLFGAVLLGIGIAFLINYKVGKKMLAKEIDAEEKLLVSQAENK